MDTIVRPPETTSTSIGTAPRRPRWRWILLSLFLLLLVVAVLVASIWIANYDPFVRGMRGWHPQDDRIHVTDVDALGASGRLYEFQSSTPARFRYTFSITNAGPIGVTIEGIGPPLSEQEGELKRHPVRLVEDEPHVGGGRLVLKAWHPFVLRPGQQADIEMEVVFDPEICLDRGTSLLWWPESITFSVFGFSRTTAFESDLEVRIVGTENCPG